MQEFHALESLASVDSDGNTSGVLAGKLSGAARIHRADPSIGDEGGRCD
jgi:hypothetical protein